VRAAASRLSAEWNVNDGDGGPRQQTARQSSLMNDALSRDSLAPLWYLHRIEPYRDTPADLSLRGVYIGFIYYGFVLTFLPSYSLSSSPVVVTHPSYFLTYIFRSFRLPHSQARLYLSTRWSEFWRDKDAENCTDYRGDYC